MRLILKVVTGLLALLGLSTLLLAGALVAGVFWARDRLGQGRELPDRMVLTADLREPIEEAPGRSPLFGIGIDLDRDMTISRLVLALDRAAADPRVAGLVAVVDETDHGLAMTQDLRDAVLRFRAAGKPALAFADSFGELAPANQGYYLASAFAEIWLQPAGVVGLTGLSIEQPFLADFLGRLGIGFDVLRRSEYKTAFDNLTEPGITAPNREMLEALLASLNGQLASGIATGRALAPERARELLLGGPYSAADALRFGLVDQLGYRDEVVDKLVADADGASLTSLARYMRSAGQGDPAVATVALIEAAGAIARGEGGIGGGIAAEDLAEALDEASEDGSIDAILIRLTSPGGSPAASETAGQAIRRAVRGGKPVVVSMGGVAASGGYWLAAGASRIVAQPATLTGSIGVIAGKPVLDGLWRELGVTWSTITADGGSTPWSLARGFSEGERARLDALVGELYRDFKQRVADARDLSVEQVESLARGRVWTGEAALPLRLVDRLGGIHESLAELRTLLGLPDDAALELVTHPRPSWALDELLNELDWSLRGALRMAEAWAEMRAMLRGEAAARASF